MTQTSSTPVIINNRYRVDKKLGEGGMGAVYKVHDTQRNNKTLALKIMKKIGGQNEAEYHDLFKKEFEVLAGLNHPHVAQAYDYGPISDGSGFFFTSEFVQGIDLLVGTKNVGIENLLEVTVQTCRALDYVHSRGLVHHDLKTDNILLTEPEAVALTGGENPEAQKVREEISDFENYLGELMIDKRIVKIIDFGLIMGEREETNRLSGTPQYMPPEKIRGERCGKRGDLYSLGVVFYLIFTRRLPFVAARMKELFDKIRDEKPIPPREIQPEIPQAVEDMILRLLSKNPDNRYSTAGEIIADLNKKMGREYSVETETSTEGYISSGKFVGRKKETQAVFQSVESIFKGYDPGSSEDRFFNTFLVSGERGIGKTRFCREVKTGFELRDIFLLDIEPHRFRNNTPLFIRELLSRLEETPGFVTYTDQDKYQQAKKMGDLDAGTEVPDDVIDYLAQATVLCSGIQPLALICSNLGDANPSFVRFAVSLANILMKTRTLNKNNEPTADVQYKMVAVFEFPAQNHPGSCTGIFANEFSSPDKFHNIVLDRMEFNEITTLIATMFGQGYIPKGFAEGLYAATGGNPRYVFEVLKDLASKMKISKTGKSWQFDKNIGKIDIPPSYKDEITHGLENLDSETENILNILATIREQIPLSMIESITGYNKDTLDFKLSVLEKRKIVIREREENIFFFRLSFDFMYDIVQERTAQAVKEGLNRQLGELFEAEVTADNRGRLSLQLAQIFLNAGDVQRSVGYALKAVETMGEDKQYEQLRAIFEQLLPMFTDKDYVSFIKVGSKLAEIYEITGFLSNAVNLYKQILEKGAVVLRGWNKALIFRKIAHLLMSQGEHNEAMEMLGEGKSFILEGDDSLENGLFSSSFALAEYRLGNFGESTQFSQNAVRLISEKGDGTDRLKREILNDHLIDAGILLYRGQLGDSRKRFRELLAEAQQLGFDAAEGMIRNHLGIIYIEKGDFGKAQEELNLAHRIFRERADEISLQEVQLNLCQSLLYQNRYMECLEHVEKILLSAVGTEGFESISGKAYLLLGNLNRYFGRHSHARNNFSTALELFQQCQNSYLSTVSILEQVETLVDLNQLSEAERRLGFAQTTIQEREYGGLMVRVETIKGILGFKKGDFNEGETHFTYLEELISESEFDYRNMFCRAQRLYYESLLFPEKISSALLGDIQVSEFFELPIFKVYINFALGMQADRGGNKEEAWDKIYQAQAMSLKFHFMELLWVSNYELNKLHVLKTGSVTNRFVNAARRYLEKIIKSLDEADQPIYRANKIIQTSSIFVVDTSGDGPDAQRNLGGIWAEQTIAGGVNPGTAQTQMQVPEAIAGGAEGESSSGFIQKGIQNDLSDAGQQNRPPLRMDRDDEVFQQQTIMAGEASEAPTQAGVEGQQEMDITIAQPPPAVTPAAGELPTVNEPGFAATPASGEQPTISEPEPSITPAAGELPTVNEPGFAATPASGEQPTINEPEPSITPGAGELPTVNESGFAATPASGEQPTINEPEPSITPAPGEQPAFNEPPPLMVPETAADISEFKEPGTDAVSLLPPSTELPIINVDAQDVEEGALEALAAMDESGETINVVPPALDQAQPPAPAAEEHDIFTDRILPPPPPGASPEIVAPVTQESGINFNIQVPTGIQEKPASPSEEPETISPSLEPAPVPEEQPQDQTFTDMPAGGGETFPPIPPAPEEPTASRPMPPPPPPVPGAAIPEKPTPPPPPAPPGAPDTGSQTFPEILTPELPVQNDPPPPPPVPGKENNSENPVDWDNLTLDDLKDSKDDEK